MLGCYIVFRIHTKQREMVFDRVGQLARIIVGNNTRHNRLSQLNAYTGSNIKLIGKRKAVLGKECYVIGLEVHVSAPRWRCKRKVEVGAGSALAQLLAMKVRKKYLYSGSQGTVHRTQRVVVKHAQLRSIAVEMVYIHLAWSVLKGGMVQGIRHGGQLIQLHAVTRTEHCRYSPR